MTCLVILVPRVASSSILAAMAAISFSLRWITWDISFLLRSNSVKVSYWDQNSFYRGSSMVSFIIWIFCYLGTTDIPFNLAFGLFDLGATLKNKEKGFSFLKNWIPADSLGEMKFGNRNKLPWDLCEGLGLKGSFEGHRSLENAEGYWLVLVSFILSSCLFSIAQIYRTNIRVALEYSYSEKLRDISMKNM